MIVIGVIVVAIIKAKGSRKLAKLAGSTKAFLQACWVYWAV